MAQLTNEEMTERVNAFISALYLALENPANLIGVQVDSRIRFSKKTHNMDRVTLFSLVIPLQVVNVAVGPDDIHTLGVAIEAVASLNAMLDATGVELMAHPIPAISVGLEYKTMNDRYVRAAHQWLAQHFE